MADAGVFGPERGRIELVGGQLYEMPPIGTAHVIVVTRLQVQLNSLNAQRRLLVQQPIRVPHFDEPQPDITVLREPLALRKPEARDCALVIEVSDTTLEFDREQKVAAYTRGGVSAVWIVNVRDAVIEAYDEMGLLAQTWYQGKERPVAAGIELDLETLFADLPALKPDAQR